MSVNCTPTAAQIAAGIARELRSSQHLWRKAARFGPALCLCGLIGKHCARAFTDSKQECRKARKRCREAFCALAGCEYLDQWNDTRGRTVDDVIVLCEKVARSRDSRESLRRRAA
jgi:hypothetical protein